MPITCTQFAVPSQNAPHFSNRSSVIPLTAAEPPAKAQPGAAGPGLAIFHPRARRQTAENVFK